MTDGPATDVRLSRDDAALLSALERGEPAARGRVFRRFVSVVEARLIGGVAHDGAGAHGRSPGLRAAFEIEDALLDVFDRAFAEVGRWGGGGPRIDLDRRTREVLLERLGAPSTDRRVLPPAHPPLGCSLHTFRRQLRPRQRTVLELRFEQEQSLVEVGGRTGLMPAEVQAIERQVRAALIHHLARHGELTGPTPPALGLSRWLPGGGRCRWSAVVIAEVAGELEGPRRVMLRRHARGCAECQSTWERAAEAEQRWLRITRTERLWSSLTEAPCLR